MSNECRWARSNFLIHALQKCQQKAAPNCHCCSSYHFLFWVFSLLTSRCLKNCLKAAAASSAQSGEVSSYTPAMGIHSRQHCSNICVASPKEVPCDCTGPFSRKSIVSCWAHWLQGCLATTKPCISLLFIHQPPSPPLHTSTSQRSPFLTCLTDVKQQLPRFDLRLSCKAQATQVPADRRGECSHYLMLDVCTARTSLDPYEVQSLVPKEE